jgi:hypothetical protein
MKRTPIGRTGNVAESCPRFPCLPICARRKINFALLSVDQPAGTRILVLLPSVERLVSRQPLFDTETMANLVERFAALAVAQPRLSCSKPRGGKRR